MSYRAAFLGIFLTVTGASAQPAVNAGTPSLDRSKAQVIEITMTNYDFAPKTLQLRRNTPYRLHFLNKGSSDHSFTSREFFGAMMIAPEDRAKIDDGEVEVPKGKSVDVTIVPVAAGSYAFHCSHVFHSMFGMHGQAQISE